MVSSSAPAPSSQYLRVPPVSIAVNTYSSPSTPNCNEETATPVANDNVLIEVTQPADAETPTTPRPHSLTKTGSLRHPNTDEASDTNDEEEYNTENLIQRYTVSGKGLIGVLEKIPILVKLAVMNFYWFCGLLIVSIILIVLRAQLLRYGVQQRTFNEFCVLTGNLVHELQRERGRSLLYRTNLANGTEGSSAAFAQLMLQQRVTVDSQLEKFDKFVQSDALVASFIFNSDSSKVTSKTKEAQATALMSRDKLLSIREGIYPKGDVTKPTIDSLQVLEYYTSWITSLLHVISASIGSHNSYTLITQIKEMTGQQRAFGASIIAVANAEPALLSRFQKAEVTKISLQALLDMIMKAPEALHLQQEIEQKRPLEPLQYFEDTKNYILSLQPGQALSSHLDVERWWTNVTDVITRYKRVEDAFATALLDEADVRDSAVYIAVISFIIIALVLNSVIIAVIISRTIIRPWQRMNKLQEETISKFVPKGFLKLIGVKQIVDVKMGTAVPKRLTTLFSDIRDFTTISEKMTPSQNFEFINTYLNTVGPVIRKYRGYIDKFLGDGFIALFKSAKLAMKAAVEMQQKIEEFAQTEAKKYTEMPIKVGIGLHSGDVIVGTVGENKRMDGSVIGDAVNLTSRLESLTKRFGVKILTTLPSIQQIKSKVRINQHQVSYRFIGKVRVKGKFQEVEIYEVLDGSEKKKEESLQDFNKAVNLMLDNKFEEARDILQTIVSKDASDVPAKLKYDQCIQFVAQQEKNWDGIEVITEK